jgi:protein-histidine pros-kinase
MPQAVPAYAAAKYADRFQENHPEYSYREAVLNPTNPANKAKEWEAEIIAWFRDHTDAEELVGERETAAGKRSLYLGRPITIKNPDCLYCHDTADKAPRTMVETYGPVNGFGWKVGETIGSQIVSVPMSIPVERADKTFKTIMISLLGVFVALFVTMNVLLHFLVPKRAGQ